MSRLIPGKVRKGPERTMRSILLLATIILAPLLVFAAMVGVNWYYGSSYGNRGPARAYVLRFELAPTGEIGLPKVEGPLDASRPLVVIDAGHGGHDPGAGNGTRREKDVTLGLAMALRDRLLAGGGIRVALTRGDDRYLALEERSGIARRLKADLFLSIHADSADSDKASGATVYTLSARGSSEEATHIAASENRADSVNGVTLGATTNDVSAILVDLSQRRTGQLSDDFARVILREGQGRIVFRERPLQSAAFVVLKSPDLPSVLFEAGYISNGHDAQRLASPGGQRAFADMTAQAIRVYFARQLAQAGPG